MKKWNIISNLGQVKDPLQLLLACRGINSAKEKYTFLHPPSVNILLETFDAGFRDEVFKAAGIIKEAIDAGRWIVIHGDYDADGICATAILYLVIKNELNYDKCLPFIPNRFDHGYGLSINSIDSIKKKLGGNCESSLLITVDSGITSVNEVKHAKELGFEVIITDHHQKPEVLPEPDCVVWSEEVVGSAIAFILGKTLGSKDNQLLSLAAIATITDLQPLIGFNRSLVKEGLEILNSNPPLGIKELLVVAGRSEKEITAYDVGFVIGPRLNAVGRLVDALDALQLLITSDKKEIEEIAIKLNNVNKQRQDKTVEMYEIAKFEDSSNMPKILFFVKEEFHEGIVGLVASRLAQQYYRPAVVISLNGKFGKGSVRSVPGVNIIEFLRNFDDLFESLGGHPMAAGFTIKRDNIQVLEVKLAEYSKQLIDETLLIPALTIDLKIPIGVVDLEFLGKLQKLKPFGNGNNEPLFLSENLGVAQMNIIGKENNHLSLRLLSGGKYYKAVMFDGAFFAKDLIVSDAVDIVYFVRENIYNGKTYVDLIVKDFKKSVK